jgi:hypothetical protein
MAGKLRGTALGQFEQSRTVRSCFTESIALAKRVYAIHQRPARVPDEGHRSLRVELDFPPETPLARGPCAMERIPGIEVWPIETIGELVRESLEMRIFPSPPRRRLRR